MDGFDGEDVLITLFYRGYTSATERFKQAEERGKSLAERYLRRVGITSCIFCPEIRGRYMAAIDFLELRANN